MIDLTDIPKDATHYGNVDGEQLIYKIIGDTVLNYYESHWVSDDSRISWLIDNLTRIEWPIELVDGAAYQFDYRSGSTGMNNAVMRYQKSGDYFYFDNTTFDRKYCSNIKLLTPEVKS